VSLPDGVTRDLTEKEKWGSPFFSQYYGAQIMMRLTCEAPPIGRCISNATVLWGKKKLCRTHLRIAEEERL